MNTSTANIYDVQVSTPRFQEQNDGTIKRYQSNYANERLHIITSTAERAIELMREVYPDGIIHQVIKRSATTEVIVDPVLLIYSY